MPLSSFDRQRKLFLIFRNAIKREQRAQNLYLRAAELCDDPELKCVLEGFHKDEARHEKALLEMYTQLRQQNELLSTQPERDEAHSGVV